MNRENNVLVLDEPTNHLDVDAKDELKRALKEYRGSHPYGLPRARLL